MSDADVVGAMVVTFGAGLGFLAAVWGAKQLVALLLYGRNE